MAKPVALSGTIPAAEDRDGLSPLAAELRQSAKDGRTWLLVALVSVSHGHRNYDKGEDERPVVTIRHGELAATEEEHKAAAELLGQMYGRRSGQMTLPIEPGIDLTPDRLAALAGTADDDAAAG
jgi:hypothetical protein